MKLMKIMTAILVALFLQKNIHAAGAPIHEDFSLVISLSDDMIEKAKQADKNAFLELADAALKLSEALRRDNSMAIDRFRPKLRAAKKAGKAGDFDLAISHVNAAKELMKPTAATWDGGTVGSPHVNFMQ